MHLHGFYFTVEATGDIGVERRLAREQQRTAVTEYIGSARTFVMSWTPETSRQLVVSLPHDTIT